MIYSPPIQQSDWSEFTTMVQIVMKSTEQIFIRSGSLHATFKSILGKNWDCAENGWNPLKCMLSQRERTKESEI